MAADFTDATTESVYEFLSAAAEDDDFRGQLQNDGQSELSDLLAKYGVSIPAAEIPSPPRALPSKRECRILIALYKLEANASFDPHADALYATGRLSPLILTIGFAMPLTAVEGMTAAS